MDSNHLNGVGYRSYSETTGSVPDYPEYPRYNPLSEKTERILKEGSMRLDPSIIEYLASIDKKLDKVIEGLERLR